MSPSPWAAVLSEVTPMPAAIAVARMTAAASCDAPGRSRVLRSASSADGGDEGHVDRRRPVVLCVTAETRYAAIRVTSRSPYRPSGAVRWPSSMAQ